MKVSSIMTTYKGLEIVFLPGVTTGFVHSLSPTVFLAPLASKSRILSNYEYVGTDSHSLLKFCHSCIADWLNLSLVAAVMNKSKQSYFVPLSARVCCLSVSYKRHSFFALPSFMGVLRGVPVTSIPKGSTRLASKATRAIS